MMSTSERRKAGEPNHPQMPTDSAPSEESTPQKPDGKEGGVRISDAIMNRVLAGLQSYSEVQTRVSTSGTTNEKKWLDVAQLRVASINKILAKTELSPEDLAEVLGDTTQMEREIEKINNPAIKETLGTPSVQTEPLNQSREPANETTVAPAKEETGNREELSSELDAFVFDFENPQKSLEELRRVYTQFITLYLGKETPYQFKNVEIALKLIVAAINSGDIKQVMQSIADNVGTIKGSIHEGMEFFPPPSGTEGRLQPPLQGNTVATTEAAITAGTQTSPAEGLVPPTQEAEPTRLAASVDEEYVKNYDKPVVLKEPLGPFISPVGDMGNGYDKPLTPKNPEAAVAPEPAITPPASTTALTEADRKYVEDYDKGTPVEGASVATEPAQAITAAPMPAIDPEVERKRVISEEDARRTKEIQDSFYTARSNYANRQAVYLNAKREKQGRIARVLTDLGITSGKVDEGVAREHLLEVKVEEAKYHDALKAKFQHELTKRKQAWGDEWDRARVGSVMHDNEERGKFLDTKQKEFLIDESLMVHKALAEQMANGQTRPEVQRSWYTKALISGYRVWQKTPRLVRYGVVAVGATGIALGAGGVIGVGGALAYGGTRIAKSVGIGFLTPHVYKGINAVGVNRADKKMGKSLEKAKANFTMERFNEFQNELQEAAKKNARSKRISKLVALGASVAVTGLAGYEAVHHNPFGSTLSTETHAPNLAIDPKEVPLSENHLDDNGLSGDVAKVTKGGSVWSTTRGILASDPERWGYNLEKGVPLPQWLETRTANILESNPSFKALHDIQPGSELALSLRPNGGLPELSLKDAADINEGGSSTHGLIYPSQQSPKFTTGPEIPTPESGAVNMQPDSYIIEKNGSVSASLTKTLIDHSNKYGYDPTNTKFKSVEAWARTTEANLRAANPKINLSLVHAGDKIYLTPSADGNLPKIGFENTSGYRPGALGNLGMRAPVSKIGFIPEAGPASAQAALDPRIPVKGLELDPLDKVMIDIKPGGIEVNPLGTPYSEIETSKLKLDPNDALLNTRPIGADLHQTDPSETMVPKLNPGEDLVLQAYFTNTFSGEGLASTFNTIKNIKISDILQGKPSPLLTAVQKMVGSHQELPVDQTITVGQYVEKLAKFTTV